MALLCERFLWELIPDTWPSTETNRWVANFGSNNVAALNVSNGALVRTVSVGTNPNGIAFDGTNMWVANNSSNTVTKIQATTGHILGTYTGVTGAFAVAFDGANVWVTNNPNSVGNTVSKL